MQVILKKDYENLGKVMDVINVKNGYARNFLIPQGIAIIATEGNKKAVIEAKKLAEKREEKNKREARQLSKKIEAVPCTISVKTTEEDKIFGSVTAHEIAEFLNKEGFTVDKRDVELEEPIRQLGVYSVKIKLYNDIFAKLKVWVVKDEAKGE
jgi:large subunit ribosomal protein L9